MLTKDSKKVASRGRSASSQVGSLINYFLYKTKTLPSWPCAVLGQAISAGQRRDWRTNFKFFPFINFIIHILMNYIN